MQSIVGLDNWSLFELLESRRHRAFVEHERSLRDLYTAATADPDGQALDIFERYCDTASVLENALVELERFRWHGTG